MSLFTVTIIIAIALLIKGLVWLACPEWSQRRWHSILRSRVAGLVVFGLAGLWFLWNVAHLGEADFGQYKNWLLLIFGAAMLGAFFYLKDYLVIRGLSVLELLLAKVILDVAYMQPPAGRLFLVAFVYVVIIQALYFATVPYRMRDFLNWLFASRLRIKQFALGFIAYGLVLVGAACTY